MTDNKTQQVKKSTPCVGCGGTGQTSYFGGASRFMFTWEDCPDCSGTGVILDESPTENQVQSSTNPDNKKN
jgi:DnaJ-class molecular chaperone